MTSYAAERAKLLFGSFRTGEANDPVTYVAAVTAILSRYPEDVITSVTHPATGLAKKKDWLPTIKEVFDACEAAALFNDQNEARLKRVQEQLEARERENRGEKPTLQQMKDKYGPDWGLDPDPWIAPPVEKKPPTWGDIEQIYGADPDRLRRLLKKDSDPL